MKNCTVFNGHARFESPNASPRRRRAPHRRTDLHQRRRPRHRPRLSRRRQRPVPDQQLACSNSISCPRHLIVVGGSYIGLEFAPDVPPLRQRSHHRRKGPAPRSRARTKTSPPRSTTSSRTKASPSASTPSASASQPQRRRHRRRRRLRRRRARSRRLPRSARRRPPAQHRRPRPRQGRHRDRRRTATSPSTTSCAPTSPASGRSATATARGAFTHTAYNDFEIVAANLLDNDPRRVSDRIPAYALYIDPPLGRVGLTEARGRANPASPRSSARGP